MNKQLAIAGFVLWLLSQGAIAFGETITSSDYFPLNDGNSWTYLVADSQGMSSETITVLPGTTLINGVATKAKRDSVGNTGYFTSDNNGIKVYRFYFPHSQLGGLTVNFSPPLIEARETISIPSTISGSGIAELIYDHYGTWLLEYEYTYEYIDKQTIQVPAGTYETIRSLDTLRIFGNLFGELFDETETDETWSARYIGVIKQIETDSDGSVESILTSTNVRPPVDLSGTIKTPNGTDICAMVLASGQYTFSCNPPGVFSLTGLPRQSDGTVKRQIYAHGFFPKIDTLPDSTNEDVVMTRSGICPNYNLPYDPAFVPGSAGKKIYIAGEVLLQNTQTPICAMVLANGQYMFSCDGTGSYFLKIPLDSNGQFKLQVYADGFAPSIRTFDEFKTTNIVRMARAVECQ